MNNVARRNLIHHLSASMRRPIAMRMIEKKYDYEKKTLNHSDHSDHSDHSES